MKDFLHDRWAGLSHIPELGDGHNARPPGKTWMTTDDWRRIIAYRVLQAYRENVRRYWHSTPMWQRPTATVGQDTAEYGKAEAEKWREYGHAALLVETAQSLILGSDQTVVVPDDQAAQDWLTAWAEKEHLRAALVISEEHSIGDGDGVMTLTWSDAKQRPRLKVLNPGFYFPDLDSVDLPGWEDDYPPVVHFGWDWTDEDGRIGDKGVVRLRQTTYRMVRLDTNAGPGLPNAPVAAPWGGQREWTCLYSVTDYRLDKLKGDYSIYTLEPSDEAAEPVTPVVDLQLDFMPVIHVPNFPAGDYHFGLSLVQKVAQGLDDLSGSDTDIAATASDSAAPPAVFTGAGAAQPMPGGPSASWWGPEGASMGYADTSRVLTAGLQQKANLIADVAINSRLGPALLGRIAPNEVPSGLALQLGFAPAEALSGVMGLVRGEKYPLLLKFALRMAQANKVLPAGETPGARLDLGSTLPSDLAVAIEAVKALLPAPISAISTVTAVRMLQQAGLPIEDAEDEVAAIRAESFAAAVALVDATGDVGVAREFLGLGPAQPEPAPNPVPDPTLPPGGTA